MAARKTTAAKTDEPLPELITVPHAARLLSVNKATAYRMIHRGQLAHVMIAPTIMRVPLDAIKAIVQRATPVTAK